MKVIKIKLEEEIEVEISREMFDSLMSKYDPEKAFKIEFDKSVEITKIANNELHILFK